MNPQQPRSLEMLERETIKLKKINAALISRVERSMDQQANAFSLFETAIALDNRVAPATSDSAARVVGLDAVVHLPLWRQNS